MRTGDKRRRWATLISIFALIAQLLLPTVHAQGWARQTGNPLLYALCGTSPALLAKVLATATPDVRLRYQQEQAQLKKLSCSLCAMAQAAPAAGPPDSASLNLRTGADDFRAALPVLSARHRATDFRRARGPPLHTRV